MVEPALDLLLDVGPPAVESYVCGLSHRLAAGLHQLGIPVSGGPPGPHLAHTVTAGHYAPDTHDAAGDADTPPVVHMYVNQDSQVPETADYGGKVNVETFAADPLGIFAQGLETRPINLLQGAFSRSGEWGRVLKPWRVTAALLLAGILVSLAVTGFDYYRLGKESERLQAGIEQTFRKAMPGTKRVVNPRVQMQQELDRLQGSQGGAGFLALLGKAGVVLKDVQGLEIGGVSFRGGKLDLDIRVPNLQMLDTIKQSLAKSGGLEVEIQSATTGKDQRVQSRLRIQRANS